MWPVAIDAALTVVSVGKTAWVLENVTPRLSSAAIAGVVCSLIMPGRNPSATNSSTLWGFGGSAAMAVVASMGAMISDSISQTHWETSDSAEEAVLEPGKSSI